MSNSYGPARRQRRQRSVKPYERPAAPVQKQSSLTSLWNIITAPFRRGVLSNNQSGEDRQASESGDEDDEQQIHILSDSETKAQSSSTSNLPSSAAINLANRGRSMLSPEATKSLYPEVPPAPIFPKTPNAKDALSSPSSTRALNGSVLRPLFPPSAPHTPRPLDASAPAAGFQTERLQTAQNSYPPSPYQPIVDFLQSKGAEKINQFEYLGLTRTLRENGTAPTQELMDYIEASASVPSAALLQSSRSPSTAPPSPSTKLFLAPPDPLNFPPSTSTSRRTRRRSTYLGVGQSSPRVGSPSRPPNTRLPPVTRREPVEDKSAGESSSGAKKRRIGDFGAPKANLDDTPSIPDSQNSVPFPSTSSPSVQPNEQKVKSHSDGGHPASEVPARAIRNHALLNPLPAVPSPLRNVSTADSPEAVHKAKPRRSDSARSQASAAILDILNDGSEPAPSPVKKIAVELSNPFQTSSPIRPRVSTSTPRKPLRVSRPSLSSNSSGTTDSLKRGLDSDNILDQIESTAPKQPVSKKAREEGRSQGDLNDYVGSPFSRQKTPDSTTAESTSIFFSQSSVAHDASVFGDNGAKKVLQQKPNRQTKPTSQSKPITSAYNANKAKPPSKPNVNKIDIDEDDDEVEEVQMPGSASLKKTGHQRQSSVHRASDIPVVIEDLDEKPSAARSLSPSPTKLQPTSIEEVGDESDKSKGSSARGSRPAPPVASRPNASLAVSSGFHTAGSTFKSTSPVVPSPLRHVSLPPEDSDEDEQTVALPQNTSVAASEEKVALKSPKTRAVHIPLQHLTTYNICKPSTLIASTSAASSPKSDASASGVPQSKERAQALPNFELPKFSIRGSSSINASTPIRAGSPSEATPTPKPVTGGFNWMAAGIKPAAPASDTWSCTLCGCASPNLAEKCTVCENPRVSASESTEASTPLPTPKPTPPVSAPSTGFNWAAAGMKPKAPATDTWSCSLCGCASPDSADKCTVCDNPR